MEEKVYNIDSEAADKMQNLSKSKLKFVYVYLFVLGGILMFLTLGLLLEGISSCKLLYNILSGFLLLQALMFIIAGIGIKKLKGWGYIVGLILLIITSIYYLYKFLYDGKIIYSMFFIIQIPAIIILIKNKKCFDGFNIRTTLTALLVTFALSPIGLLFSFYSFFDIKITPSHAMEPTIKAGDRVFLNKISVHFDNIDRDDIITFDATDIDQTDQKGKVEYIKRVIAIGGDKFCMKNGNVYINGKKYNRSYKIIKGDTTTTKEITIPKGYVFVMGDNRINSFDSRYWDMDGYIHKNKVKGYKVVDGLTLLSKKLISAKALWWFR